MNLKNLTDAELLQQSLSKDKDAKISMTALLQHLAENYRRRLFATEGFHSLFAFCVDTYRMSEPAAARRVAGAKALVEFPELSSSIESGELCLSVITLAMSLFRKEKALREERVLIFAQLRNKSYRDAQTILLQHSKNPKPIRSEKVTRLSPEFTEFRIIADAELTAHLKTAKDEYNCQTYAQLLKKTVRPAKQPRETPTSGNSRYISKFIKHRIRERDQNQCTKETNGRRCECKTNLQFDHIIAWAQGGKSTLENLRLRCHAHNQQHAHDTYGPFVKKYRAEQSRH